jgi:signal transduction histidine kinase
MSRMGRLPLALRVPLAVAALMVFVGIVLSERVLTRLDATQTRHLAELGDAYLDGISSSIIPAVLRADVWEVFDTLERARELYRGLDPVLTVVADRRGIVLAASDPRALPVGERLPPDFVARFPPGDGVAAQSAAERAYLHRALASQGRPVGDIYAVLDIAPLVAERRGVLATLVLSNAALTLLLAAGGFLLVHRMVAPVRVLADHLAHGTDRPRPIPPEAMPAHGEHARLFRAYNALVAGVEEREALTRRLAEEERLASLGRLASGMAHEINNPLGGLVAAVDTLRRQGGRAKVRAETLDLLDRGLAGIRDVVRAALVSYRGRAEMRPFAPADLEDVRVLVAPEIRRRALWLTWTADLAEPLAVDANAVRQALINLLLNAAAATPEGGPIALSARRHGAGFRITVDDSGPGMPAAARSVLTGPGEALPSGPHLGLWLVRRLADETGARLAVGPGPLGGARVTLDLPLPAEEGLPHVA